MIAEERIAKVEVDWGSDIDMPEEESDALSQVDTDDDIGEE
ncbi:hypothetical protein [Avibacterium paragallinarum]|nr:hypothetical protein [Avibacterium paragallinarum]